MYCPILTYHSIDSGGSVLSVSPKQFQKHMNWLVEREFHVLPLEEALACIRQRIGFPEKSIVLTFDDGFKNFYTQALPILKKLQFRATVFLVSGRCGMNNNWPGQSEGIPSFDLLDWNEIQEAARYGIDFGSHTLTHPNCRNISGEQVLSEIRDSQTMIHERLGKRPSAFSYPYGIHTPEVEKIVRQLYLGACSVRLGLATSDSDPYHLPRVDMYYFSKNDRFTWCASSSFRWYLHLRQGLRRLRGVGA